MARVQLARQLRHWTAALVALDDPENFASAEAWRSLEGYLDLALRRELQAAVDRLRQQADVLARRLAAAQAMAALEQVRAALLDFRRSFQQVETLLDFYGDAVNSRTNPKLTAILRACDHLADASMRAILPALRTPVPPVLTYVDKGMGASILRAGLRLWDPDSLSPAAAIKVTRHNLYRPTALIHETGHQVAFLLGWNDELAHALRETLAPDTEIAEAWAGWASEVAADAFAFAHCGFAAVAGLHDVLSGEEDMVFRAAPGDPHPIAYVRVLLGTAMCRDWYGHGPWDDMDRAWRLGYPLARAPASVRALLWRSASHVAAIAATCLRRPYRAFGGRSLHQHVDPHRVSPLALRQLTAEAGPALYTSPYWLSTEGLRLLALSGYHAAAEPDAAGEVAERFERWMLNLGRGQRRAA